MCVYVCVSGVVVGGVNYQWRLGERRLELKDRTHELDNKSLKTLSCYFWE